MPDEEQAPDPARARDRRAAEKAAARARIDQQHTWVDLQVQRAIERGDFDDLPGAGKPLRGLGETHDPDWWVKKLVEREQITLLPPSVQLRREDAELDGRLDRLATETEVREAVEDFNARVIHARYSAPQGPPLVTMPRDVEATVAAWAERRALRRAARPRADLPAPRRRWWQWRSR